MDGIGGIAFTGGTLDKARSALMPFRVRNSGFGEQVGLRCSGWGMSKAAKVTQAP